MAVSHTYCPPSPLMILAFRNNHDRALPVPAGKQVEVRPDEDDRFVVVTVDGEEFLAFAEDVQK